MAFNRLELASGINVDGLAYFSEDHVLNTIYTETADLIIKSDGLGGWELATLNETVDIYGTPSNGNITRWHDPNTISGDDRLVYDESDSSLILKSAQSYTSLQNLTMPGLMLIQDGDLTTNQILPGVTVWSNDPDLSTNLPRRMGALYFQSQGTISGLSDVDVDFHIYTQAEGSLGAPTFKFAGDASTEFSASRNNSIQYLFKNYANNSAGQANLTVEEHFGGKLEFRAHHANNSYTYFSSSGFFDAAIVSDSNLAIQYPPAGYLTIASQDSSGGALRLRPTSVRIDSDGVVELYGTGYRFNGSGTPLAGGAWFLGSVETNKALVLNEKSAVPETPIAAHGYLWVKNDAPNKLYFTDDAGTDFLVAGAGAGATVETAGPSPTDNQIAVFNSNNTISGDDNLQWDAASGELIIGDVGFTTETYDETGSINDRDVLVLTTQNSYSVDQHPSLVLRKRSNGYGGGIAAGYEANTLYLTDNLGKRNGNLIGSLLQGTYLHANWYLQLGGTTSVPAVLLDDDGNGKLQLRDNNGDFSILSFGYLEADRPALQTFTYQGQQGIRVVEADEGGTHMPFAAGSTTVAGTATIEDVVYMKEVASGLTNNDGYGQLYVKSSNSKLYFKNDFGIEYDLTTGGGGGGSTSGIQQVGDASDNQIAVFTASGFVEGNDNLWWDGTSLGLGTSGSPEGRLHVKVGDAGVTPHTSYDDLVVESDSNVGISLLATTSGQSHIVFGDGLDNDAAAVYFNNATGELILRTYLQYYKFDYQKANFGAKKLTNIAGGNSTAPGLYFSDSNTGLYSGSDYLGIATGGTSALYLDNSTITNYRKLRNELSVYLKELATVDSDISGYSQLYANTDGTLRYKAHDGDEITLGASEPTAVFTVGNPVNNQVAVWTASGQIEGTSGLTYNGSQLSVTGNIAVTGTVDGVDIATLDSTVSSHTSNTSNPHSVTAAQVSAPALGSNRANHRLAIWNSTDTLDGANNILWDGEVFSVHNTSGIADLSLEATGSNSDISVILKNDAATWTIKNSGTDSDRFQITQNSTNRLVISSAGAVGLGVDGPVQKLEVAGNVVISRSLFTNSNANWLDLAGGSTATSGGRIRPYGGTNATYGNDIVYAANEHYFKSQSWSTDQALLDSDGLTVYGGITIETSTSTTNGTIRYNGSNFQGYHGGWINLDSQGITDHTALSNIGTYTHAELDATVVSGQEHIAASAPHSGHPDISGTPVNNQIAVWTDSNTLEGDSNFTWTESTFKAKSTPGAATSTPICNLQQDNNFLYFIPRSSGSAYGALGSDDDTKIVFGNTGGSGTGNSLVIAPWASGTKGIIVTVDGNVGINTETITESLNINGNIALTGTVDGRDIATDGTNQDNHIASTSNPHSVTFTQAVTADGSTDISAAECETLTDNSIADALHRHSELVASDGSPDPALSIDASGNIGIGETSPNGLIHAKRSDTGIAPLTTFNELILEANENNVGINILNGNASNGVGGIYFGDETSAGIGGVRYIHKTSSADIDKFQIITSSTARLTVDSSGNVGIGTDTPGEKLEVVGNILTSNNIIFKNDAYGIRADTTDGSDNQSVKISGGGDHSWSRGAHMALYGNEHANTGELRLQAGNVAGGEIVFYTNGAEVVRIDDSRNFGIGTASPSEKLHVAGNALFDGDVTISGTLTTAGGGNVPDISGTPANNQLAIWTDADTLEGDANLLWDGSKLYLEGNTTESKVIEIGQGRTSNGYSYIDLIGDATYTDYGLRLIRMNTGANAYSALRHRGTGNLNFIAEEAADIACWTSGIQRMTVDSGGDVGIGTSSPNGRLEIEGLNATAQWLLNVNTNGSSNDSGFYVGTGNHPQLILKDGSGTQNVLIKSTGTSYINSGDLGIGTDSPGAFVHLYKLTGNTDITVESDGANSIPHISLINDAREWQLRCDGGASDAFVIRDNTAPRTALAIDSNGKVGLGTASPVDYLTLVGDLGGGGITIDSASGAGIKIDRGADTNTAAYYLTTAGTNKWEMSLANGGGSDAFRIREVSTGYQPLRIVEGTGEVVINEDGLARDFRVESDTNVNMLFVNGTTNKVGIGTGSPGQELHVNGNAKIEGFIDIDASNPSIYLTDTDTGVDHRINSDSGVGFLYLLCDINSEAADPAIVLQNQGTNLLHAYTGEVVINQDSADIDFRVESNGNANMLFVDGGNDRVAIGTTTTSGLLHLQTPSLGTIAGDYQRAWWARTPSSNADALYLRSERLSNGSTWSTAAWKLQRRVDTTELGYIGFGGGTNMVTFGYGSGQKVCITSDAKLGIGNSLTPRLPLHVNGPDGDAEGDPTLGSDDVAMFQNNGVAGDNCTVLFIAGTTGDAGLHFGDKDDRDAGSIVYYNTTDEMQIWTGAGRSLTIDGNNLGIGADAFNPAANLHIAAPSAGSAAAVRLDMGSNDTATNTIRLNTSATKYWQIGARGDSYATSEGQNVCFFSFWNGSTWNQLVNFDANDSRVGIGTTVPSAKLHVNGDTRFDGSIGLNTTPSDDLHIYDSIPAIRLQDSTDDSYGRIRYDFATLIFDSDAGNTAAGSAMRWYIDADEKMRMDSSGNLLLGATTAGGNLHVERSSGNPAILLKGTAANNIPNINLTNDAINWQLRNDGTDGDKFKILEGGSTRLTIAGNKVGLGTTDPDDFLTVSGALGGFGITVESSSGAGIVIDRGATSNHGKIVYKTAGTVKWSVGNLGASDETLQLYDASGNSKFKVGQTTAETVVNEAGLDSNFRVESDTNINMLFVDAGNNKVGIGTSSIDGNSTFDVNGTINALDTYRIAGANVLNLSAGTLAIGSGSSVSDEVRIFSGGGVRAITIDSSQNVGIGTTSPVAELTLNGFQAFTTANGKFIGWNIYWDGAWKYNSNDYGWTLRPDASGRFQIWSAPLNASGPGAAAVDHTAKITIDNDGNLGIGTASPSAKLDVVGNLEVNGSINCDAQVLVQGTGTPEVIVEDTAATTSALRIVTSNGVNFIQSATTRSAGNGAPLRFTDYAASNTWMTLDSTGNLGIGTTGPSEKLDVVGNLEVNGNIIVTGTVDGKDVAGHIDSTSNPHSVTASQLGAPTGSGATNRLAFWSGTNTLSSDADLTWSGTQFYLNSNIDLAGDVTPTTANFPINILNNTAYLSFGRNGNYPCISSHGANTNYHMLLNPTAGNVGIGITGAPGEQLEVGGSIKLSGNIFGNNSANSVSIAGGNTSTDGAYIRCYGSTNATHPNKLFGYADTYTFKSATGGSEDLLILNGDNNYKLQVRADEDYSARIGRAHIGYNGVDTDWAMFAHIDQANSVSYALAQSAAGATILNGGSVYIVVNDASTPQCHVSATGLALGKINAAQALDVVGNIAVTGTVDGVDVSTLNSTVSSHTSNTSNPHSVTASQVGAPDISGTPVNNQIAIWTDANTLEGDADLTFDGTKLTTTKLEVSSSVSSVAAALIENTYTSTSVPALVLQAGPADQSSGYWTHMYCRDGDGTIMGGMHVHDGTFGIYGSSTGATGKLHLNSKIYVKSVTGGVVIGDGASYGATATAPDDGLLVEGNVGIGTTTASATLTVNGNISMPAATTESRSIEIGSGRSGNGYAFIDLIGDATYTDYGLRLIRNNTGANTTSSFVHRGTGSLQLTTTEAGDIEFKTSNTLQMTLDSNGDLGIGVSPSYTLDVWDNNPTWVANFHQSTSSSLSLGIRVECGLNTPSSAGDCKFFGLYDNDGGLKSYIQNAGATGAQFSNTSDARLKEHIKPTDINGLEIINQIPLRQFDWIGKANSHTRIGYVAQEIEDIYPEMVSYHKEEDLYTVADSALIPVLTKAIQEQQDIIEEQKTKIDNLESRLAALEALLIKE